MAAKSGVDKLRRERQLGGPSAVGSWKDEKGNPDGKPKRKRDDVCEEIEASEGR